MLKKQQIHILSIQAKAAAAAGKGVYAFLSVGWMQNEKESFIYVKTNAALKKTRLADDGSGHLLCGVPGLVGADHA
jgi:hypothetical protein